MVTREEVKPLEAPQRLPYGVGQFTPAWTGGILALLALVGLGAYAYSHQVMQGEIVTGLRNLGTGGGATWGLYIAFELFITGVGFGAMILVAITRLSGLPFLRPLYRLFGQITLTTLLVGALSVVVDEGQPLRGIVNLARYVRPMSPFFGTFTIGLFTSFIATAVYLFLECRRDAAYLCKLPTKWSGFLRLASGGYKDTPAERERRRQTSLALALFLLVAGVGAASTSGFIFGIQLGRPGWYSALQAPAFVALASASGAGFLTVSAAIIRQVLGARERLPLHTFAWLSNFLTVSSLVYIYFLVAEMLTLGYAGRPQELRLNEALLTGQYAWLFWLSGGLFLVAFLVGAGQALLRRYSLPLIVAAGVLVNLASLGKRYLLVVPPLTHGSLLPYGIGSYAPTWVEYTVVIGLLALGTLLCVLFMKVFPILQVRED